MANIRSMAQGARITGVSSLPPKMLRRKRPLAASAKRKMRPKSAAQHQAAREISGASKKIAQLHGTTGRTDVASARAGMVAESIRQRQALIAQREGQQRFQNQLAVRRSNRRNRLVNEQIRSSRSRRPKIKPRNVFTVPTGRAIGSSVLTQRAIGARRSVARKKRPVRQVV